MNEIRDVPDVVDCRGLRVVVWRSAGWTGLDLTGDIDLASAPTLVTTLDGLLAQGACHLALDLTYVDFFGAQGLRVLDDLERRCRSLHGRLVLVQVSPHVRRVLVLMNAQRLLGAVLPERVGTRSGRTDAAGHDEHLGRPGRLGLPPQHSRRGTA
jgi:anti-sigma B factor antagonist